MLSDNQPDLAASTKFQVLCPVSTSLSHSMDTPCAPGHRATSRQPLPRPTGDLSPPTSPLHSTHCSHQGGPGSQDLPEVPPGPCTYLHGPSQLSRLCSCDLLSEDLSKLDEVGTSCVSFAAVPSVLGIVPDTTQVPNGCL